MKKLTVIILSLCAGLAAAPLFANGAAESSAAPSAAAKGKVEIVLSTGDYTEYVRQQMNRVGFAKLNPQIEVKISPEGTYDLLMARIAANDLPGIYASPMGATSAKLAASGKLLNLKQMPGAADLTARIDPAYVREYQGGLYALPWMATTQLMVYNVALFKEAGLDPQKPPRTFDEFLQCAEKISRLPKREDGSAVYGTAFWNDALAWGSWYWACMAQIYLNFNDGTRLLFNQDGTDVVIDKPESGFKAFIDFMAKAQKYASPSGDGSQFYNNKNIGMFLQHGYGWKNNLRTAKGGAMVVGKDVLFAPIPALKADGSHWSTLDGRNLLVFRKGAGDDAAAWELVKFLMRDDVNLNVCQGVGQLPVLVSAKDDPFFQQPGDVEFVNQAKKAVLLEGFAASDAVQNDLLGFYLQAVVQNKMSSDEMVARLAEKARQEIKAGSK
jgi:multiple sugar transport system substrate-binding protein